MTVEYQVQIIPQIPNEANDVLKSFAEKGWRLHTCFPMLVQKSHLNPQPVPALYCVLERRQLSIVENVAGV